jgi:hypothetical protein
MAKYLTGAIVLNSTTHSGIINDSFKISSDIKTQMLYAGGESYASMAATLTGKQTLGFDLYNLGIIVAPAAITSLTGCLIAADELGSFGTGAISFAVADGIIVPVSISAAAGQEGKLSVMAYANSSTGTSEPLVIGTTKTAPSVVEDYVYTVGQVTIGSELAGCTNIDVQFGYEVKSNEGDSGLFYPTLHYVSRQEPVVTATLTDISAATQARLNYGQLAAATVTFRKLREGAIPDGALTITMTNASIKCSAVNGGQPGTVQIELRPVKKATGSFFAFSS